ncbi:MAG: hypothetical protein KIT73_06395 [Burkholderiales bacterium]|nr:hypothetical protein [Burkholderiales bacterium]
MYIVAIGWGYVVLLMAVAAPGFWAGVGTVVFGGVLPLALVLWLFGGPRRRRAAARREANRDPVDDD